MKPEGCTCKDPDDPKLVDPQCPVHGTKQPE